MACIVIILPLHLGLLWLLLVAVLVLLFLVIITAWEGPPLADPPVGCLQLDGGKEGLVGPVEELQCRQAVGGGKSLMWQGTCSAATSENINAPLLLTTCTAADSLCSAC